MSASAPAIAPASSSAVWAGDVRAVTMLHTPTAPSTPDAGPVSLAGTNSVRPCCAHSAVISPPSIALATWSTIVPPRTRPSASHPRSRIASGRGAVDPRASGGASVTSAAAAIDRSFAQTAGPALGRGPPIQLRFTVAQEAWNSSGTGAPGNHFS